MFVNLHTLLITWYIRPCSISDEGLVGTSSGSFQLPPPGVLLPNDTLSGPFLDLNVSLFKHPKTSCARVNCFVEFIMCSCLLWTLLYVLPGAMYFFSFLNKTIRICIKLPLRIGSALLVHLVELKDNDIRKCVTFNEFQ